MKQCPVLTFDKVSRRIHSRLMYKLAILLLCPAAFAASLPVYQVTSFGAKGDGKTLDSSPIQQAIDQAASNGGGVVYFQPGVYLSGSLVLKSGVTLYLEAGARILASADRHDYFRNVLISAEAAHDIAIRGRGAIDGNAHAIMRRVPGGWLEGSWRPRAMIQFFKCENVLLEGITLRDSPNWTIHPVDCDRVTIQRISIIGGLYTDHVVNADGVDLDGCSNVIVSSSYIQSSDDAIVLKITDARGAHRLCRDIKVTNCVLATDASALKIGSETNGEFRNINFSDCTIRDAGNGIGLWMYDDGLVSDWTVSNISMTLTHGGEPLFFTAGQRTNASSWGVVRNVHISHVTAVADGAIYISGARDSPFTNITLEDISIYNRANRQTAFDVDPPLPFQMWGFRKSPFDIFVRYVNGFRLRNSQMIWASPEKAEWGGAVRVWNANDVQIDDFSGREALGSRAAAITLRNVKNAVIRNSYAQDGTTTFLRLAHGTTHVTLMNNDLSCARAAVQRSDPTNDEYFETGNRPPRSR